MRAGERADAESATKKRRRISFGNAPMSRGDSLPNLKKVVPLLTGKFVKLSL
jgi:hypothetical protein